jgi:hypothetical protein
LTAFVSHTAFDCLNAYELSEWWKQVLGYVDVEGDPNLPGHEECMILEPRSGHRLLFIEVPDAKQVKNGVHLDLCPRWGTRDDELGRLVGMGAGVVDDLRGKDGPGTGWVVLSDPEGNEFCILRSEREREAG